MALLLTSEAELVQPYITLGQERVADTFCIPANSKLRSAFLLYAERNKSMERSDSQQEASRETVEDHEAHLDEVDHSRLAELVAASPQAQFSPTPIIKESQSAQAVTPAPTTRAPGMGKSYAVLVILVGSLLLALAGVGIAAYWMLASKSSSATHPSLNLSPSQSPQPGNPPETLVKHEMIAIPGGTFQMGRDGGPFQETPPHTVTVAAFQMDNTEVTNAEYAKFVEETGHAAPVHFVGGKPVTRHENWPVVNVSFEDVMAFAAWRSKRDGVTYRLPTEEEWEYAARNGDQNTLYPWGNTWEENRAATKGETSLRPVGSFPLGRNRWGVFDLIGNVWEWTSSKASIYPGSKAQLPPEQQNWYVFRGGSILTDPRRADKPITSAYRDWISPTTVNPQLGFRLVRPAQ